MSYTPEGGLVLPSPEEVENNEICIAENCYVCSFTEVCDSYVGYEDQDTIPVRTVIGPMYGSPTEDECNQRGFKFNIRASKFYGYSVIVTGPIGEIYNFAQSFRHWQWEWENVPA